MRRVSFLVPALLLLGASGAGHAETAAPDDSALRAAATVVDAQGRRQGEVIAMQTPRGVLFRFDLAGLSPGAHGVHLHETGDCDPSGGFAAAGGHFDRQGHAHGVFHAHGQHDGDMPSLQAGPDGRARAEAFMSGLTLDDGPAGLADADGTAIVIHARGDDGESQPGGNAGPRVACGVLVPMHEAR